MTVKKTIGIVGARRAELTGCTDDGIAQGVTRGVHGDLERATDTPPLTLA